MIELDTQIIPTARAMSFSFSGRVQLSKCAKNFTLPSAQEQFDKAAAKDKYTEGGDVKLGNYTWKTLNFTWNKQPSVVLYADITEGLYAEVTLYETTLEDAAVNAFLEGVKFATDYDAAHKAGMDTTVEKFAADNNLKLWEAK